VFAYRLLGYENRAIADNDFRNDVIDAGEVGAGHRVTAFYEVVAQGGTVPASASAPALVDGGAYSGPRQVAATDLALVKVRYKHVDATEADAAVEVSSSLSPADVAPAFSATDLDMQWALAIAAFAEILKRSPYADAAHLDVIGNIANAQAGADADRAEFLRLFNLARPRIATTSR
jgi:Ca-activated chloride channel family protein